MNKGFWIQKKSGHSTDGDTPYNNPSIIQQKRSHDGFDEPKLFANKKQLIEAPNTISNSENLNRHWENASSYPNQFMTRLFGSDPASHVDFSEGTTSFEMGYPNKRKGSDEQVVKDSSVSLSISNSADYPFPNNIYGGLRADQVKDSGGAIHGPNEHVYNKGDRNVSMGQVFDGGNGTGFVTAGQEYKESDSNVMLMGHTYYRDNARVNALDSPYDKRDLNTISIDQCINHVDNKTASFSGFQDGIDVQLARPISSYNLFYNQSSVETSGTACVNDSDSLNAKKSVAEPQRRAKPRADVLPKIKSEPKAAKREAKVEAPNSFPTNVRTLISTGILDGVPVKYVSHSREEHRGIIKGSGYLCGCQACNFTKALNAFEFEKHAGFKTKHPNSHIYFENGKTIYQIVQELKSTPESLLFDAIQVVTGSPINQKAFRSWKESYQAATRELQRIYGKEEPKM